MSRRRGRELALKVLYQMDIASVGKEEAIRSALSFAPLPEAAVGFGRDLVDLVVAHRPELDERLAALSRGWRVERMPAVDRSILRMALAELMYLTGIPVAATINEAVELAKNYGSEESPKFVNGVLSSALAYREERQT